MKRKTLIYLMGTLLCSCSLTSCGGGGGGGGDATAGHTSTSGSSGSVAVQSPTVLPSHQYLFFAPGSVRADLIMRMRGGNAGGTAIEGGSWQSSFCNIGMSYTYTKTGPDTATIVCKAEKKQNIEEVYSYYSNGQLISGTRVVGTKVVESYLITMQLKFLGETAGRIVSFSYVVNGATRKSFTNGTFQTPVNG